MNTVNQGMNLTATQEKYPNKGMNHNELITVTKNPKWSEILERMTPGQQPHDLPDLLVRVLTLLFRVFIGACLLALLSHFRSAWPKYPRVLFFRSRYYTLLS